MKTAGIAFLVAAVVVTTLGTFGALVAAGVGIGVSLTPKPRTEAGIRYISRARLPAATTPPARPAPEPLR
jgi:hypothetical protein